MGLKEATIKQGLLAVSALDIVCVLVVVICVSGTVLPFSWGSPFAFHRTASDLVFLLAIRIGCVVVSCQPGRRYLQRVTKPRGVVSPTGTAEGEGDDEAEETAMLTARSEAGDSSSTMAGRFTTAIAIAVGAEIKKEEDPDKMTTFELQGKKYATEFVKERQKSVQRKVATRALNLLVVAAFGVATLSNVYVAVKGLSFHFDNRAEEIFLCLGVLWTNLEAALLAKYLNFSIDNKDALEKEIHTHPLRFNHDVSCTKCSVCNFRIIKEGFECPDCDYNVCLECFRKKTKAHGENNLHRTDKGIENEPTEPLSTTQYMWKVLKLGRPFKKQIGVTMACLLLNQTAKVLSPNYQGQVIDSVVKSDMDRFTSALKVFVALSVVQLAVGSVKAFSVQLVTRHVNNHIRTEVFKSLLKRDVAFFDGSTTGSLTSRITQDVRAMVTPLNVLVNTVISNILLLLGGFIMCMHVSWRLSMIALTVVGPIVHVTGVYANWSRKINRRIWDSLAEGNNVATQAFTNVRTVKAFSTENLEMSKYNSNMDEVLTIGVKDAAASGGSYFITNLLDLLAMALILGLGGSMVMASNGTVLTVGELITFQLYANMMNAAYKGLNNVLNVFTKAAGAADRVFAMLETPPGIGADGTEKPADFEGEMEAKDVDFFYQMRPKNKVLNKFSAKFEKNKVTAMVGKSGGGKSTVMHLLLRFYDPTNGEMLLDGRPLKSIDLEWLHQRTSVVAQETQLFATTIEENITYGLESYTQEELRQAAAFANALEFIDSFDDGFRTTVGERGTRLSGGQKQRIAIARAFLRKPKLLLLDEATSALDSESEAQVQEALDKLMEGLGYACTIVVVAHRLSTVVKADKILVLSEGQVVEEGVHADLLEKQGVYANLIAHQLSGLGDSPPPATRESEERSPPGRRGGRGGGGRRRGGGGGADLLGDVFRDE